MEYFKHDINASEDEKICELLANGGYELLGYYWRFIEYLYSRGGKANKNNLNGIAWSLHMDADKLSAVICNYDLFYEDENYIYSERVLKEVQEFEAVGKRMAEIGRKGGQASAKAVAQADAQACAKRVLNRTLSDSSSDSQAYAQQNKIKENKRKENKKEYNRESDCENRKRFTPPLFEEVKAYASEKGREDLAKPFFEYFDTGKWIDSKGNPVRNWKQKFLTWCNKSQKKEVEDATSFKTDEFFTASINAFRNKNN